MVSEKSLANLERRSHGRKRGSKNKVTKQLREFMRRVLTSPEYLDALEARLRAGKSPELERFFWAHQAGTPPTAVHVNASIRRAEDQVHIYLPVKDQLPEAPALPALPPGEPEDDDEDEAT